MRLMVLTVAQRNAKRLLRDLQIDGLTLRKACADIELSVSVLRRVQRAAAEGNTEPRDNVAASLVARGVSDGKTWSSSIRRGAEDASRGRGGGGL